MPWSVPLTSNKRSPITKQEYKLQIYLVSLAPACWLEQG